MNTCKTCRHWSEKTVADNDEVTYDSYSSRHYCWLLSDRDKENEGIKIDSSNDAEAAAHGIGGAAICTGEDFGCIHHSEKRTGR